MVEGGLEEGEVVEGGLEEGEVGDGERDQRAGE